jgi:hypothetical protein
MSLVQRVTSVTLVTLLAVVGPSLTVHADAAGAHDKKHHKHHKHHLTTKERYAKEHPRLIRAVTYALRQRGDKYRFGAEGPKRWDCSGLVYFGYRKAGFRGMPRTSRQQYHAVRHIKPMRLQRGDLMFFHTKKGRVHHVAIFLGWRDGHRLMLHAPGPGRRVQRERPWTHHFWAGTLRHKKKKHG